MQFDVMGFAIEKLFRESQVIEEREMSVGIETGYKKEMLMR